MYEILYAFSGIGMLFWLLLLLLPGWKVTRYLANTAVFPIYLGALYAIGVIFTIAVSGLGFIQDFNSAEGVIRLASNPGMALLIWIHILCFDQTVGHYVYRDNMEHRYVPLSVQSILLFLIIMFGPLGFLCYLAIRAVRKRAKAG